MVGGSGVVGGAGVVDPQPVKVTLRLGSAGSAPHTSMSTVATTAIPEQSLVE